MALSATCGQSSHFRNLEKYRCEGAIDGVSDKEGNGRVEDGKGHEWASNNEGIGAWITLTLSKPAGVVGLNVTNRGHVSTDMVSAAAVEFDNGEKMTVSHTRSRNQMFESTVFAPSRLF